MIGSTRRVVATGSIFTISFITAYIRAGGMTTTPTYGDIDGMASDNTGPIMIQSFLEMVDRYRW